MLLKPGREGWLGAGVGEMPTSAEIGVDIIGFEEHGFANFKFDVVQEEEHEKPDVAFELAVTSNDEVCKLFARVRWAASVGEVLALFFGRGHEVLGGGCDSVFVGFHQSGEGGLQSFLVAFYVFVRVRSFFSAYTTLEFFGC